MQQRERQRELTIRGCQRPSPPPSSSTLSAQKTPTRVASQSTAPSPASVDIWIAWAAALLIQRWQAAAFGASIAWECRLPACLPACLLFKRMLPACPPLFGFPTLYAGSTTPLQPDRPDFLPPTKLPSDDTFMKVATGSTFACGLLSNFSVACFGGWVGRLMG